MYNIYQFEKKLSIDAQKKKLELKTMNDKKNVKAKNAALGEAYRQRVGEFISKMVQKVRDKSPLDFTETKESFNRPDTRGF